MTYLSDLTDDCLTLISSLTSHKEVVGLSAALKQLVAASKSDAIWEKFLPSNCDDIVSQSSSLIPHDQRASRKKLFIYLTRNHILLDGNTKSFALDETSGKICYMLGSKALHIEWGNDLRYWSWESDPGSRFPVCAVLNQVCWLEINGKISTTLLSRGTSYGAYFVFKLSGARFSCPVKVSFAVIREYHGKLTNTNVVDTNKSVYLEAEPSDEQQEEMPPGTLPVFRADGWMEIEMGRYQIGVYGERAELVMGLTETEPGYFKKGLIIHGIEIRPLS